MPASKKKRGNPSRDDEVASPAKKKTAVEEAAGTGDLNFSPLSLQDIRDRIQDLARQVPPIPPEGFYKEGSSPNESTGIIGQPPDNLNKILLKTWASELQVVLEELGLVLCCVSSATYRWGTDRSGAADQNLTLLNDELNSTQDQIASRVTPRLRNVLTPVVDLVVEKTITTKERRAVENGGKSSDNPSEDGTVEVKRNVFTRQLEDPDFVHLCYEILARNAEMMRLVVTTNLLKMCRCISDYLAALSNDTQHHREFAY